MESLENDVVRRILSVAGVVLLLFPRQGEQITYSIGTTLAVTWNLSYLSIHVCFIHPSTHSHPLGGGGAQEHRFHLWDFLESFIKQ